MVCATCKKLEKAPRIAIKAPDKTNIAFTNDANPFY